MRRWAPRIFVFLLLGAIVNVAVAWACSLCFRALQSVSSRPATPRELNWIESMGEAPHRFDPTVENGLGRRVISIGLDDPVLDSSIASLRAQQGGLVLGTFAPWPTARRLQAGFPFIAFESFHLTHTFTWEKATGIVSPPTETWGGWLLSPTSRMDEERSLPVVPVWPGFAINTVLYAAVVWLTCMGLTVRRRRRSIRRGLCTKCGYDLRGSAPEATICPECGATR
jgi:hypothetical protein